MASSHRLSDVVPSQKPQAYQAFKDIIPVPIILVTSEEINVISWKTSMVSARSLALFTGSTFMNTLTPMVAATPTSKGARSWDSDGKKEDDVRIVKMSIAIGAVSNFLYSSRHMIQALQTTTPSVRAYYFLSPLAHNVRVRSSTNTNGSQCVK